MNRRHAFFLPAALAALTLLTVACSDEADNEQPMIGPSATNPAQAGQPAPPFASATASGLGTQPATATAPGGSAPAGASGSATPAATGTAQAGAPQQMYAVRVTDSDITPATVTLPQGLPVHLSVSNSGGKTCLFYVGDYLTGLLLEAGKGGQVTFPVPAPSGSSQGTPGQISMGCSGNDTLKGQVSIQPAGPNTQSNPNPTPPDSGSATVVKVTARDGGLDPANVAVQPGRSVRLEITVQGGPCRFFFGEELRGLLLPGGATGSAAFETRAPVAQGQPPTGEEQNQFRGGAGGRMGCEGEPDRQGTITYAQPSTP